MTVCTKMQYIYNTSACSYLTHLYVDRRGIFAICTEIRLYAALNTLRPRQDGRHFPDDIFKRIFLKENISISIKVSLNFVPKGRINNIWALILIMTWRRPGDKPLSERMYASLDLNELIEWCVHIIWVSKPCDTVPEYSGTTKPISWVLKPWPCGLYDQQPCYLICRKHESLIYT